MEGGNAVKVARRQTPSPLATTGLGAGAGPYHTAPLPHHLDGEDFPEADDFGTQAIWQDNLLLPSPPHHQARSPANVLSCGAPDASQAPATYIGGLTQAVEAGGLTQAVEAGGLTQAVEAGGLTQAVEAGGSTQAVEAPVAREQTQVEPRMGSGMDDRDLAIAGSSQESRDNGMLSSEDEDEENWHPEGTPAGTPAVKRALSDGEDEGNGNTIRGEGGLFVNKRVRFTTGSQQGAPECPDDANAPWAAVNVKNPEALTPRWGATLVRIDEDSALLLGGESDREGVLGQALTFSTKTLEWSVGIPNAPVGNPMDLSRARCWHSSTKIGENIFIFGGEGLDEEGDREPLKDLICLDLSMGCYVPLTTSGAHPGARSGHAACRFEDKLVVWGGVRGTKWLSDMFLFDTNTLVWKKCKVKAGSTSRPAARSYATLTVVGDKMILYGGNEKNRSFSDIHIGTFEKKNGEMTGGITWREPMLIGQTKPIARTGHIACATANSELIVGCGWDDLGLSRRFYSDVWKVILESDSEYRWKLVHKGVQNNPPPSQPGPRAGAALCESGESSHPFIVGGFSQKGQLADVFELLNDKPKSTPKPATSQAASQI